MIGKRFAIFAVAAMMLLAACVPSPIAAPGPDAAASGPDNGQHWWIPVPDHPGGDKMLMLEAVVYRPTGEGPFPLVEINHGVPPGARSLDLSKERPGFHRAAEWFVAHGFAVVVPLRRGFGKSQGDYRDAPAGCSSRSYFDRANYTAADEGAVIDYMSKQAFIDPERIFAVGQSVGGLGVMALGDRPPPGVRGIINFAGGAGGDDRNNICGGDDALVSAVAALGARNQLPQIWLYAANDGFFDPKLARQMFDAYREHSLGPITFVGLPPFGNDGHQTLRGADPSVWAPAVEAFIRKSLSMP